MTAGLPVMAGGATHPAYPQLLELYRTARGYWALYPTLRDTAAVAGMTERLYCDAFVNGHKLSWPSSATTDAPLTGADFDRAYEAAA